MARVKEVGKALRYALSNSDAQDIVVTLGDAALTAAEGLPVIQPLVSLARASSSISDQILALKLAAFCNELVDIPADKRERAIKEIEASENHRQKVGETLVQMLDRADSEERAQLIAWLFKALIEGKCNYGVFEGAVASVQSISLRDLRYLNGEAINAQLIGSLSGSALVVLLTPIVSVENFTLNELEERASKNDVIELDASIEALSYCPSMLGSFVYDIYNKNTNRS